MSTLTAPYLPEVGHLVRMTQPVVGRVTEVQTGYVRLDGRTGWYDINSFHWERLESPTTNSPT